MSDEQTYYYIEIDESMVFHAEREEVYQAKAEAMQDLGLEEFPIIWMLEVPKDLYDKQHIINERLPYDQRKVTATKPRKVLGFMDLHRKAACIVLNNVDLARTVKHEARHLYQEKHGIGRYASEENEWDAERYATDGLAAVRRKRFDLSTEAGRKAALFATMRPDGTFLNWPQLQALEFYDDEEAA